MIKYLKRNEIDFEKYDYCIENSFQSSVYAFSWYLDIVADNWDVLVLHDYKAVMPIPWKKKYGISYITQPYFCQQLGIFSLDEITMEIQRDFIGKIPKKYLKISLHFNSNSFLENSFSKKKNYVLCLNDIYENLFKSFNKGRKHAVKSAQKNKLTLGKATIESLMKIKEDFYRTDFSIVQSNKLKKLSKIAIKKKKGFLIGVFEENTLLGGAFFLETNKRIVYLFSAFNSQGKSKQASSFLINEIIKKYQASNVILDFEGSEIANIASFFKSFGAKNTNYYQLEYHNLPVFYRLFKKQ